MAAHWVWWILRRGADRRGARHRHVLPARRRHRVHGRRRRRMARRSTPRPALVAGVLAVVGSVVAHRWRMRSDAAAAAVRSTSASRCRCRSGTTTARRASTTAARSGTRCSRSRAPRRERTMYIVATRGSTLCHRAPSRARLMPVTPITNGDPPHAQRLLARRRWSSSSSSHRPHQGDPRGAAAARAGWSSGSGASTRC